MNLQFKNYRIRKADRLNFELEKFIHFAPKTGTTGPGRDGWIVLGHHGTLRQALRALLDEEAGLGHAKAQDVLTAIEELRAWIDTIKLN